MMNNLEIYIHIPFCVKKCDYCDFLSAPSDEKTMRAYVDALKQEIKLHKAKMEEYLVDTVFIGGGTPSILDAEWIEEILNTLKDNCHLKKEAEITIECNPGTVTEEKLLRYKDAGINRLSFGLQSASDEELKLIGRIHTYEEFLDSFQLARKCGFDNINIDLMSALPGQTIDSYKETLRKVLALKPEHISAYSLIVEEGTALKQRVENALSEGKNILPNEDDERAMYHLTKTLLEEAGYRRYEISNYAKEGYECRHNIGYWKRKEYLGFGIGAASLYREERYSNIRDINLYMKELEEFSKKEISASNEMSGYVFDNIEENKQIISREEQMEEFMFLGLRMIEGVSVKLFEEMFGKKYDEVYGKTSEKLISQGLLEQKGDYVRLTERGIDISNYVMSEFLF